MLCTNHLGSLQSAALRFRAAAPALTLLMGSRRYDSNQLHFFKYINTEQNI